MVLECYGYNGNGMVWVCFDNVMIHVWDCTCDMVLILWYWHVLAWYGYHGNGMVRVCYDNVMFVFVAWYCYGNGMALVWYCYGIGIILV